MVCARAWSAKGLLWVRVEVVEAAKVSFFGMGLV